VLCFCTIDSNGFSSKSASLRRRNKEFGSALVLPRRSCCTLKSEIAVVIGNSPAAAKRHSYNYDTTLRCARAHLTAIQIYF
jgi:hypothetical protein